MFNDIFYFVNASERKYFFLLTNLCCSLKSNVKNVDISVVWAIALTCFIDFDIVHIFLHIIDFIYLLKIYEKLIEIKDENEKDIRFIKKIDNLFNKLVLDRPYEVLVDRL